MDLITMKMARKKESAATAKRPRGWDASKFARQVIKENRQLFRELSKL
ncbi:MAG: hypothetical protein V1708_05015 [Candidatus Micrarchaeota archaeon]